MKIIAEDSKTSCKLTVGGTDKKIYHVASRSQDLARSLMFGCFGRKFRTCISAAMDSVMASSWDLSMILTAYSTPFSREMHFLTVLDRPLYKVDGIAR